MSLQLTGEIQPRRKALQDWLPEDHLARFIADVANELDLSAIYAEYERKDVRGLSADSNDIEKNCRFAN